MEDKMLRRSAVDELSCGLAMRVDSRIMARLWGLLGWARMRARVQGRMRALLLVSVRLQAWTS
jgi:hypothetical protein